MPLDLAPSLSEHEEWAVGLNYWFIYNFVLKASYHYITGNRFAISSDLQEILDEGIEENTQLFIFGAQFSF